MNFLAKVEKSLNRIFPRESFQRRYFSGTIWMSLGTGAAMLSTFAATVIAARILGSEVFGKYGILQSTLGLFALVAGFGVGLTNKRYVAETRDTNLVRCGQIIGFSNVVTWISGSFLALVLFVFSSYLASDVLKAPELVSGLRVTAGILLLNGLNEAQLGALSGLEEFRKYTLIAIIRAAITFPAIILGMRLSGLTGMMGGMALTAFIIWIISGVSLRKCTRKAGISISYENVTREGEIFLHFILPVMASGIIPSVVFWTARTLMVQYPDGYQQLGIVTAAEQWLVILSFIPGQMAYVSQPILSNLYGKQNVQSLNRPLAINILLPTFFAALAALVIFLLADKVTSLYGHTFVGMSSVLVVICIAGILRVLGGTAGTLLVTINRMWVSFGINLVWGTTLIVFVYFLAHEGAMGYTISNIIAYTLSSVLTIFSYIFISNKYLKQRNTHPLPSANPTSIDV